MLVRLDGTHRGLIHQIRRHAEEWLAAKGTDQYQSGINPDAVRRSIDGQIDAGAFVGWCVDGQIVAILALIEPDAELWTPEEVEEPQTYITHVMVAEDQHGKGYGAAMLDAVADSPASAATTGSGSTAGVPTGAFMPTTKPTASSTSEPSTPPAE